MRDGLGDVTSAWEWLIAGLGAIGAVLVGVWRALQKAPTDHSIADPAVLPSIAVYPIEYGRRLQDYKDAAERDRAAFTTLRAEYDAHIKTMEPHLVNYALRGQHLIELDEQAERDRQNCVRAHGDGASNLDRVEARIEKRLDIIERQLRARRP